MVEVAFHYSPIRGPLHGFDPRFKILATIFTGMALFICTERGLLPLSILTLTLIVSSRIPVRQLFKETKGVAVLLVLILLSKTLISENNQVEGFLGGLIFCFRLIMVIVWVAILTGTTSSSEIRSALVFLLKPVPFLPHQKIAAIMTLSLSMVPMLLDQSNKLAEAQKARGFDNIKNPVKRIGKTVFPLILVAFRQAETTAEAMESRSYGNDRTEEPLDSTGKDWFGLFLTSGIIALSVII